MFEHKINIIYFRLKTDNEKYMKKCEECVEQSKIDIYKQPSNSEDNDPNYLHFDHYNEEIHGAVRRSWHQQKVNILLNKIILYLQCFDNVLCQLSTCCNQK